MKFPSIQTLAEAALKTFRRFPCTVIFLLVACFFCLRRNHLQYDDFNKHVAIYKIIYCAYLGMLLSLSVALYAERRKFSLTYKWIGALAAVVLAAGYYFSLPNQWDDFNFRQIALLIIGLHLLIAIAPFLSKGEVNGFWQYNKSLFLRILAAALYSSVFFIGLSLALLAVEKLFSVDIHSKWYEDLGVIVFRLFNSLFFFAGIPEKIESLYEKKDYPKGLKIFTQYVLIPLIIVYFAILYAYVFRIIVSGKWPYGWVSYLVLAFAIAGIFSLLLIYPIRKETQNKWMLIFTRIFYFALCPLILMLFIAILRRINAYGITAERYFVFVLACWLTLITLYFIFSADKNIKIIPITLCILAFGISFGPWGAFSVSGRSQTRRLMEIVRMNGMINADQKIVPASASLHKGDAKQIRSIIEYLIDENGYHDHSLQPLFAANLDSVIAEKKDKYDYGHYWETQQLTKYLRIDQFDSDDQDNSVYTQEHTINAEQQLLQISGFEYLVPNYHINQYDVDSDAVSNSYSLGAQHLMVIFYRKTGIVRIVDNGDSAISLNLHEFVRRLNPDRSSETYPQDSLILSAESRTLATKLIFKELNVNVQKDSVELRGFEADILLRFKRP
jgi:hypothetical protein